MGKAAKLQVEGKQDRFVHRGHRVAVFPPACSGLAIKVSVVDCGVLLFLSLHLC